MVLLLLIVFALSIYFVTGQACNPGDFSQCGQTISTQGNGAVELCQTCFYCGDGTDNVCPEDFSDGTPETDVNKKRMYLRVGDDRPSGFDNPIIFDTANAACQSMGGTCSPGSIETKTTLEGENWVATAIGCDESMSSGAYNGLYVRVNCDLLKMGNCQECPDPDCIADVRGITFDNSTDQNFVTTHVNIISTNNQNIRAEADSTGVYSMQAFRGRVRVVCTSQDFDKYEKEIYLKKGDNLVDCRMTQATCSAECTLPDVDGSDICRPECDGQNGCNFYNSTTMSICDNVPLGSTIVLRRIGTTDFVEAVTCCSGAIQTLYRPLSNINSNNIPNLLTRDYRKKLNGMPVTVRVITYSKN